MITEKPAFAGFLRSQPYDFACFFSKNQYTLRMHNYELAIRGANLLMAPMRIGGARNGH